jgi:hypothetical protein
VRDDLPTPDVAVINVTREIVEAVAPRLRARTLVASGYLSSEPAMLPGWRHVRRAATDGWAADLFAR